MDFDKARAELKKEMRNEVRRLALDPQFLKAIAEVMSGQGKKKVKKKKDEKTGELF